MMARTEANIKKVFWKKRQNHFSDKLFQLLSHRMIYYTIMAFLFARATMLKEVSPFAISFFVAFSLLGEHRKTFIFATLLIGASTISFVHAFYVAMALTIYLTLSKVMPFKKANYAPYIFMFFSIMISRVILYSIPSPLTFLNIIYIGLESSMGILLLYIFLQSLPQIMNHNIAVLLRIEDVLSLVIFIASTLLGLSGLYLLFIPIEHVITKWIVLIFAFIGGAPIGAMIGVVLGVVLTLGYVDDVYFISLLALTGLLGGLFYEWNKYGVIIGLFVSSLLFGMYGDMTHFMLTFLSSFLAAFLLLITPKTWLDQLAIHIPNTKQHLIEQRQYVKKIRHVTAEQVEKFSTIFATLANSFVPNASVDEDMSLTKETDELLHSVTKNMCNHCFLKKHCWQKEYDHTYQLMLNIKEGLIRDEKLPYHLMTDFQKHCVKANQVVDLMKSECNTLKMNRHLKHQVLESKKIVAEQLRGVSHVMHSFANEMVTDQKQYDTQEKTILQSLKKLRLPVEAIETYSLEEGNIDIDVDFCFSSYLGEAEKIVAPVLSSILEESIIVDYATISQIPNGVSSFTFRSARKYTVKTGAAMIAQNEANVSGDNYTYVPLSNRKFAIAISDGMGNGRRAHEESKETLHLLKEMMRTGISEEIAIQSINSILSLRTSDEIFSTLDLAMFNLYDANVTFLKISAMPSFIKRHNQVWQVSSPNLPIGMIDHVQLNSITEQLQCDDIIVMLTDGVLDSIRYTMNNNDWVESKLKGIHSYNPQYIADRLLDEVIRESNGAICDDMTIVVAKVSKHEPKWSPIVVGEDQY